MFHVLLRHLIKQKAIKSLLITKEVLISIAFLSILSPPRKTPMFLIFIYVLTSVCRFLFIVFNTLHYNVLPSTVRVTEKGKKPQKSGQCTNMCL